MEKDSLFSKWYWENWTALCKSMKLKYTIHKNKLKMVKVLNIRHDPIQLLEENIGKTVTDVSHIKAIKTEAKWDLIKFISFCTAKETLDKMKGQPMG